MQIRTYGWVQNPSSFSSLKKVVQIFDPESAHYSELKNQLLTLIPFDHIRNPLTEKLNNNATSFSYTELVGTSKDIEGKSPKSRTNAVADSLIQISILPQKYATTGKKWTDNWTADGFLRWAVTLNFVSVDRNTDIFTITETGLLFSKTKNESKEETDILRAALLSYPPATRILSLLRDKPEEFCTKFYIGSKLGFRGEKGFTSYNENLMFDWLLSETDKNEKAKIKSDIEGTSDKYARGICNWLKNVGFVSSGQVSRSRGEKIEKFVGYKITAQGTVALNRAEGSGKNTIMPKFLMWEFLATDGSSREYIRTRRAHILQSLKTPKTLDAICQYLRKLGFNDEKEIVEADLQGLQNFGLRIAYDKAKYLLKDELLPFSIPNIFINKEEKAEMQDRKKAAFLRNTSLEPKYIDLLDMAYDGSRNRDFEMVTIELFSEVYQLESVHLGGGRKPDGIAYTDNYGIIVDTKAYQDGYGKNISQADEMIRYIEDNKRRDASRNPSEWWICFPQKIQQNNFYFLWVSSFFKNKFQEQLEYTSSETGIKGAALSVEQLLIGANEVIEGRLKSEMLPSFFKNKEIIFKDYNW